MKFRLALATLVLAVLPGIAVAMCQGDSHQTSTSACADGQSWDPETRTCLDTSA